MSIPILRDYQDGAVDTGAASIRRNKSGIIAMPTGSGKSLVIAGLAKELDAPLVVLQPTKEILEQNYRKLYEFGERDIAMFSASVGRKQKAKVTFATVQSIIKRAEDFADARAVVVDECHLVNAKGGQYQDFIAKLGVPSLGLTATPYRMSTSFGGQVVEAKFLHRTRPRLYDHISYIVQNDELHDAGYLAPIRYHERDDYDPYAIALNSTGLNYKDDALAAYNRSHELIRKAADTIIGHASAIGHFLVFLSSIEESKELASLLATTGLSVDHIDGTTHKRERERILGDFLERRTRVVCNVGVLTTGFDFPALDAVVLARPMMSLPLYYQMVGRCVRTCEGKIAGHVFDLCGNVARFGKPDQYHIEPGEREKHRLRSGKRYLTGVNFVSGRDLEKQRDTRAKKKASERAKSGQTEVPLDCPNCGEPSIVKQTQYGRRDDCERCDLHSWDGKPMVSQQIHDARKHCHETFDKLWNEAETMYGVEESPGTLAYKDAVARIRRSARSRSYRYLAFVTGLPEPECHMSDQADIEKLRIIWKAANAATPETIREWWKGVGQEWWEENKPKKAPAKEAAAR